MTESATVQTMPFGPLSLDFDDTVLLPRPWTLAQSRWAAELLPDLPAGPVLELCAGVGHIGLAAVLGSGRRLVLVDAHPRACELARVNAARVDVGHEVREARLDEALHRDEQFALALVDPPWVPTNEVADHPADPVWAIDGGDDGLDVARHCVTVLAQHLMPEGRAILQLGTSEQTRGLAGAIAAAGLQVLETRDEERGVLVLLASAPAP